MATPQSLNHSLLRPCIIHILRAAGYHQTKNSTLDTLTDLAARYMLLLAQTTANHAALNHTDPELALDISISDVRMAMQDCGVLTPEKVIQEQEFNGEEDIRGVENFIKWATGPRNHEIRRIALEGSEGAKEDYLTALKKKHSAADEQSRYNGTVLGKPADPRVVKVEGSDITSLKEWTQKLKSPPAPVTVLTTSSRRQSSALSSLGDQSMLDMDF
ncbi:related to TAF(II) complex (TBP-associated protein complex) component [Phialocephala subalpina]|uniref:Related to TAF(II) complex (TBP-associated protein complex) component n=1 Tax=Phialocephala subalpina TaxID=576137 RepID=A0A1L7XLH2_9HELO|nr:related to TAF(II) complex (TBP-associated protein complex) component [Phialocephala subalpina]